MSANEIECVTRRFSVTGRVQGVFFRDSTRREALRLGLTGYAINLDDGSVDVVASGDPSAVRALESWLREGPRMASVSAVIEQEAPKEDFDQFGVG